MSIFRIALARLEARIMETVISLVLSKLQNSGDKVLYQEVYDEVPAEFRGQIRNALKQLKADGQVRQEVIWDGSKNIHNLVRV